MLKCRSILKIKLAVMTYNTKLENSKSTGY